jgi:hypothetical protein
MICIIHSQRSLLSSIYFDNISSSCCGCYNYNYLSKSLIDSTSIYEFIHESIYKKRNNFSKSLKLSEILANIKNILE